MMLRTNLRIAFFETQKVINEYYAMSRSDGDFALDEALKRQHQAMDKYVALCRCSRNRCSQAHCPTRAVLVKPRFPNECHRWHGS
jgi:hypothetical protein